MKLRTVLSVAVIASSVVSLVSCKDYSITNEQINEYQDSVFAIVPTKVSVQARTEGEADAQKQLRVVMGVGAFYDAPIEEKQAYAIKAGQIAIRQFGDVISQGSFVLTKKVWNETGMPPDAIVMDMKLDSLRQAMGPKK